MKLCLIGEYRIGVLDYEHSEEGKGAAEEKDWKHAVRR